MLIHSILAEVYEPPLHLRRKLLSLRYACKLRQMPSHPTYHHVFSRCALSVFQHSRVSSSPFCTRIRELCNDSGISLRGVTKLTPPRIPPWELATPTVDVSLAEFRKSDTLPEEFRSRALEVIGSYDRYTHTYTDGSKTDAGVGCAFVMGLTTRSFTLPSHATVYTSELIAIHKALSFIEVCEGLRYVIFSDSLSSLLALMAFNPSHPLLQDVLGLLTSLDRAGKSIVLCWIPGHVGLAGNEQADQAAKRATRAACTRSLPLPATDLFPVFKEYVLGKWQSAWDEVASKLKEVKPQLAPWHSVGRKLRVEEVTLCRLRIGHTYATHKYLLCGEERPRCSRCGDALSVRHVLVSCRHLRNERVRFFGVSTFSFQEVLGDDSCHISEVFRFLAHVGFPVIFSSVS